MSRYNRRSFLKSAGLGLALPPAMTSASVDKPAGQAVRQRESSGLIITAVQLHTVKVNERGDWHFIELKTNKGLTGVGECSHAFTRSLADGNAILTKEVENFFGLIDRQSPFNIELFRQRGGANADTKLKRTVFSSIEQALWDLYGKALGVPAYQLLGGKLRDEIRVYANINRATNERDANGRRPVASFRKNAEQALKNGFTAVKLAPFDEMKPLPSSPTQIEEDIDYAIDCIEGVRAAIGKDVDLLIDVHSHLNVALAQQTAKRIESSTLYWFEEPVDPQKFPAETKEIRESVRQTLAGGEAIFGRNGYRELLQSDALGIIMPDVKHCGGLLECRYIAAMAEAFGNVRIAPHNPSGPVATAASVAVCAGIPNFAILEYAFGEVPWSGKLVTPAEEFRNGHLKVGSAPGLGISLNHTEIKKHS